MIGTIVLAATFANPVLPADFSDLDCIQKDGRFYAITSTLHCSPGMDVLESSDMVNWNVTGHVVDDTSVFGEDWTWKRMRRYGLGVWAGCIRERGGRFYCYFGTPDEGIFVATAEKPSGPWTAPHKMAFFSRGWDDTGVLFEDGRGYLVATQFSAGYKTYIFDLTADGLEVVPESQTLINEGQGREANKLYKWNGTYYHLYSEVSHGGRRLMMARAKNPKGPYDERRILSHPQYEADEPNQGGFLVDDAGNWFFFTHHGHGQWYGRAASLLPVTWIDGWPIVGKPDKDGIGTMVWNPERPVVKNPAPPAALPKGFLSPDWAWNHAPRRDKVRISEDRLELDAFRPLKAGDFFTVGNVFSRRSWRNKVNKFSACLLTGEMADGQRAGICHFGGTACEFGVKMDGGAKSLYWRSSGKELPVECEVGRQVWLRTDWGMDGVARFAWSSDGRKWRRAGEEYQMTWGRYRGDRTGLFTYNDIGESGTAVFRCADTPQTGDGKRSADVVEYMAENKKQGSSMTNAKSLLAGAAAFAAVAAAAVPATVDIDAGMVKCPVAQDMWGIFFEDIDLSLDGGVYAELVRNRSFEDGNGDARAAVGFWREEGGAKMELSEARPLSDKNRHSLKVAAPAGGGVSNEGYFGIAARPGIDYRLSIAVRGDAGKLRVALESADGKAVSTVAEVGVGGEWKTETASFQAVASDPAARLSIRSEKGGTFFIDCVSLFPSDTYGTSGIFRRDLMERLAALKPAFVRFPGGCWVEGDTMKESYRWKKTIGSIWERPTQWNIWGYWATHGVGFHEYLLICEELGAKPLFCINVGMSHKETVPMDKMDEFVQDALDCIEYCNGPVDSKWGAVRAAAGHPAPFNMEYLEIGNENGGPEYEKRYKLIADAVRAKYPNVKLVFDNWASTRDVDAPKDLRDDHFYMSPDWFMMNAGHYADPRNYDARSGKFGIFVGEYAVTQGTGKYGSLRAAIGEAAFMTGLEYSSDVVKLAAYAPLFANVKHQRWSPDMIYVGTESNFVNPSFEVQRLFAENRGKDVLETKVESVRVSKPRSPLRFGVGTWSGQAAFKDVKVVDPDGKVLYENDFRTKDSAKDWKNFGAGKWEVVDGALTQTGPAPKSESAAFQIPMDFGDATFTLKAKSVSGPEGFLILIGDAQKMGGRWVNFGGWGNGQHGVESPDFNGTRRSGSIDQGRWYDVKVEVRGGKLRAWLDGKLAIESESTSYPAIVANAVTSQDEKEIIVKVVNCASEPVEAVVAIHGESLASKGKMTLFTGPSADACNSMERPDALHAVDMPVEVSGGKLRRVFPALSFSIIRIPLSEADGAAFAPTWKSLERHVVPKWYENARFGIFCHWGMQCAAEDGDWYARCLYDPNDWKGRHHRERYGDPKDFGAKDLISIWKGDKWNPDELCALYRRMGATFILAMANHHDNFDNWNSKYQPWNSVNMGPKRDILGEWSAAARKNGLRFGESFHAAHAWTWYEVARDYDGLLTKADGKGKWWEGYDPQQLYWQNHDPSPDYANLGLIHSRWNWGNGASRPSDEFMENFRLRTMDAITKYKPDLIYFDDTVLPFHNVSDTGLRIVADFYNMNPDAVAAGKVLNERQRKALTWDVERGTPPTPMYPKWQTDTCIGCWHYERNFRYRSAQDVIRMLVDIVSKNGNLCLSIPIRSDGTIDDNERRICNEIAAWMEVNRAAIFDADTYEIAGEGPQIKAAPPISAQGFNEGRVPRPTKDDVRYMKSRDGMSIYAIELAPDGKAPHCPALEVKGLKLAKSLKAIPGFPAVHIFR